MGITEFPETYPIAELLLEDRVFFCSEWKGEVLPAVLGARKGERFRSGTLVCMPTTKTFGEDEAVMNITSPPRLSHLLLAGVLMCQLQASVKAQVALDAGQPTLVEVGPHELIWKSASGGRIVTMETGMNYWDGRSWVPSDPSFELTDEAFVANRLQYKVRLAANLNQIGAVTLVSPDGITLHSTPVGIGLYDAASGQSAIIASITNCSGILVGENRVVYADAFAGAGVCADVVYTIDRGSFAQDVVITGRLNPADYGFPTNTTRIQIFTEFYQSPEPESIRRPIRVEKNPQVRARMVSPDLIDEALGFGELVLATGRAATLANISDLAAPAAPVAKEFTTVIDPTTATSRTFLIESIEYNLVKNDLQTVPECGTRTASMPKPKKGKLAEVRIPSPIGARDQANATPKTKATRMAQASFQQRNGFAIDYLATIGGTLSGTRVFAGDTTYFLTNAVTCSGAVTIESGAVFKFPTNSTSYFKLTGTVTCRTASFRPAIFTAADDDTVGDTLSTNVWAGYTGTIRTNGYGNPALWVYYLSSPTLSHLRFRYSQEAIRVEGTDGYTATVAYAQLVNCIRGVVISGTAGSSGTGPSVIVTVNNSLLSGVQKPFSVNVEWSSGNFYHGTIDRATYLISSTVSSANGYFYNSVFANVTNMYSGSASAGGNHNGFYSAPAFGTSQYTTTNSPFQSIGAGNYYLSPGSSFRDVGITNGLSSAFLSELRKRTTYAPVVLTNTYTSPTALTLQATRDTNTLDLGYHYEPIDWAVNTLIVSGTTLSLTDGVSLATFGNQGIWLSDSGQLYSEGTPTTHNHLARFFNVQEQPINWGGGTLANMISVNPYNYNVLPPTAEIRFTDFDGMANSGYHVYTTLTNWTFSSLLLKDCSLSSAAFFLDGPASSVLGVTNNLFERVTSSFKNGSQISLYNNLIRYGTNSTYNTGANNWLFKDNVFDNSWIIDTGNAVSAGYNAYINMGTNRFYPTNASDKVLTSLTYLSGALGSNYQQTSSALMNAGSRAADAAGLYHYTTVTTQVKETNSTVDIGFHYVAVTNGSPIDTDGDGLPDYLEDRNGNGTFDSGETSWTDPSPSVTITNPVANSLFVISPTNIVVNATAADNDSVTNVAFYYNRTNFIGQDASSPYSVTWSNVTAGTHTLSARAWDNLGASTLSAPVTIIVNGMPSVSLTNPASGMHFSVTPTNITLAASASDGDGTVTNVAFFVGTNFIGQDATSPYSATWSNISGGSYSLTAQATDNRGATAISSPVTITANGALSFGSTNAYVTFGNNTNLGLKFFTLETWFKKTGNGTTVSTGSGGVTAIPLVTKGRQEGSGNKAMNYFLGIDSTGVLAADFERYANAQNYPAKGVTVISNDIWYHAAATYNGTNWILYLNGEVETNRSVGPDINGTLPRYDSIQPAAMGTTLNSSGVALGHFTGLLDEVRIWNYARTRQQIRDNMNREISNECGLVAHWALNEGVGTTVTNATGTAITGSISNSDWNWTNSAPYNAAGAALFVVGNTNLSPSDAAIKARLNSLNYNVTVRAATNVFSTNANLKTVVVISSSVIATNVGIKFRSNAVPVVTWQQDLYDDMGMVASNSTYYGTTASQSQVDIVSPGHELAAGLSGTVTIVSNSSTFAWGQPTNTDINIATLVGNPTNIAVFGYEKGAGMVNLVAPARRVGLCFTDSAITNLNANGWALFDAAITWAAALPCPPVLDLVLVIDHSSTMNGQPLANAKYCARYITTNVDLTLDQIAVVSFDDNGTINTSLTHNTNAVLQAINGIPESAGTRLDLGIDTGFSLLTGSNHVVAAAQVMIILTDGDHPDAGTNLSIYAASQAKLAGTRIICAAVVANPLPSTNVLLNVATSCSDYYVNPTNAQLDQILASINATLCRVSPNQPPSVTITNPTNGATLLSPTNVLLQATASDIDGTITNVAFYNGGNLLGAGTPGTGNSYSFVWTNATLGTNSLTAVAKDNGGLSATSSVVVVIIPSVPQVQIVYPTNGAVFFEGTSLTITAQVVNAVGTVTNVEFYTNYIKIGNDTTMPYTAPWNSIARGSYGVFARAYNDLGTVGQSAIVSVLIDGPPTITILTPPNNAQPAAPANIRLTSIAEDDGTVINVTYFLFGTNNIGSSTVSPYSVSTNNLPAGKYWFKAIATDNRGQTATAYVTNDVQKQFPTVEIISPHTNDVFAYQQPILIQARATDVDGTVTNVVFKVENTPIGTNSIGVSNIFTFLWTNAPVVTSTNLFAVATDNHGQSTTSAPVNIKVQSCQSLVALTNFTLSASNIPSGLVITGAVYLASGAVDGGQVVNLFCTNVEVIIPGSVLVPQGAAYLEFPIWTRPAEETSTNLIRASTASEQIDILLEILGGTGTTANQGTNQTHLQIIADTNTAPPLELVKSIVGEGILIYTNSIVFKGTNWSAGLFSGGSSIIAIESGLVLGSGNITNLTGTNSVTDAGYPYYGFNVGDADLDTLQSGTEDATVLEFGFIPESDSLTWDYVFASEELDDFVGRGKNDVFGFFVNGTNVAYLKNGVVVAIDNINYSTNQVLYLDNRDDPGLDDVYTGPYETEMDGFTRVLRITTPVNAGASNYIKMAIADVGDNVFDSLVMIKAGSFRSGGVVIHTRDDLVRTNHASISLESTNATMAGDDAVFNLTAIGGTVEASVLERAGRVEFNPGNRFEFRPGVQYSNVTSFGLAKLNANQSVSPFSYDTTWTFPPTFYSALESNLNGSFHLPLIDQLSGLCASNHLVVDQPHGSWPTNKNILTFAILSNRQVPAGRCIDLVLSGLNSPVNGDWDIVFQDQVIASSGKPNGWDLEEDHTVFNGFIVTVPTNAVPDRGYEIRARKAGAATGRSAIFTVMSRVSIPSAPVLLPLRTSTNMVASSGTSVSVTVAIDAGAPFGGSHVSLKTNGVFLTAVVIPEGLSSVTTNIAVLGNAGSDFEILASYNGYRKAKVRVAGDCSSPLPPGNLSIKTNGTATIELSWYPVSTATGYNIRRSIYAPTNFVLLFSGLTATNFIDRDVTAPNMYYYQITAFTNWCESGFAQTNLAVLYPGRAPAPTIIPYGGTFNDQVDVLITNYAAGATNYYTTNGEPPTASSDYFTGGKTITLTNSTTVRAYAHNTNYSSDSRIVSPSFIITHPASISCGQTNYGALTATNAFSTGWGQGFFNTRYAFTATSGDVGKLITATASSADFDTVLLLKDGSTNILAANDDYSADTTDSRVSYRVRNTGLHILEVTSYAQWETGDFSIALTCQGIADLKAFTNAYPTFKTNSAPLPNFGAIDFGTNALGASVTNWITITNAGNTSLVISNIAAYPSGATNNGNGFFVSPGTLTIQQGNTNYLAVWLVSTNPAIFSGYLIFESNDAAADGGYPDNPFYVELTGQVKPNPPSPVVYIYYPTNGMNIPATNSTITNVTLAVGAIAFDPDGISRVVFLTNGTSFVTVSNAPYLFTWTNPPAGSYTLQARSFDSLNNQLDSTNITITVGAPTLVLNSTNNCVSLSNRLYAVEARLTNGTGQAVSGATVTFIVSGAHNFTNTGSSTTDSSGRAVMTYTGTNSGSDWIFASASVSGLLAQAEPLVRSWARPAGCTTVSNFSAALSETDGYGRSCQCSTPTNYADYYSITGAINDVVTFKMKSTNFATLLVLLDTNCNRVAWANEMLSLNDSQLRLMLPSNGTYIVEATSSDLFKTGNYTLEIRCGGETAPDIAALVYATNFPSYTLLDLGVTNINAALTSGITITNKGNAALNITGYSFTLPVFSITPSPVTTIPTNASASFTVQFLSAIAGQYTASLVLTNDDPDENPFVVNLTAIANPNGTPPTVAITAPANNSSNIAPANITIQASATPNGTGVTITNVAFVFRSQGATYLIGNDFTQPYSVEWQNVPSGNYQLLAVAQDSDGRTKVSAPVAVTVKATSQNQQPVTTPDYPIVLANSANNVFYVLTNDYDPDGDVLIITNVTVPAYGTNFIVDGGRAVRFIPKAHQSGTDGFSYDVSDGKGGAKRERVWITVEGGPVPLVQIDNPLPNTTLYAGTTNTVTVSFPPPTVVPNIVRVEYYVGEDKIGEVTSAPFTTFAWHTRAEHCECGLKARVYDKFGQFSESNPVVYDITPPATNYPVASISSPGKEYYEIGHVPQLRTTIVQDGILVVTGSAYRTNTVTQATSAPEYKVIIYSPEGSIVRDSGWIQAAAPIFNSAIITNDLTTLRNDIYEVELLVRDDYQTVSDKVQFALDSQLKIGPFTFSEQDMVIPVNGMPLTVVRTYDSMNPNKGDFGYSWTYAINDLDVTLHETRVDRRPLFDDEEGNQPGGKFSLRVAGSRDVTLTLPDGRRATFYYYEVPGDCSGDDGVNLCAEPRYFSPPGVTANLRPVNKYGGDIGGYDFYTDVWKSAGGQTAHENFDFPGFILTLQDGTEFYITRPPEGVFTFLPDDTGNEDDGFGEVTSPNNFIVSPYGKPRLAEIRQRSGDRIVINLDGFVDGKNQFSVDHFNKQNQKTRSISFVRDEQGRISEIRDPISGLNGTAVVKYVYDAGDNLSKVLKLVNRSTGSYITNQYFYENSQFPHYLTKIIDSRGNQVARNLYDDQGRLIGIIDASGRTNRFEHDLANNREIQYDRSSQPTQLKYDSRGNVLSVTDPLGHTNGFTYDANGYRLSSADALGHTTYFTNDADGNVLSILLPHPSGADPADYTTQFSYDEFGNQTRVQLPTGGVIANEYDAGGNLTVVRDGESNLISSTLYDGNGLPMTETDRFGSLKYTYDALGNLPYMTNSLGKLTVSSYDANGNLTNLVDNGQTNTINYDALNRETGANYGNNITVNYGFEGDGEWTTVSGPTLGNMERHQDEQGRLSGWETANGSSPGFAYDVNGRMQYETNSIGVVTFTVYDVAGRVVATTNLATGAGSAFGYDAAGQRTEVTNALGYFTRYAYNVDGSLAAMTDPLLRQWMYDYDTGGACCGGGSTTTTVTDPLGRQRTDLRSAYGLPVSTIWRSGTLVSSNYIEYLAGMTTEEEEAEEYPVAITDEGGRTRRYEYDDLGRLYRATDLSGATWWTNQFDPDTGALTNVLGPTGEKLSYTYDELDNIKTIRFGDNNYLTNFYNAENRLSAVRLPSGVAVSNFYDFAGRLTNRSSTIGETATFEYNGNDAVTRMTDNTGGTTNLHDAGGRLWGIDYPSGASVRYQLDVLDRITAITNKASAGGTTYVTQYQYDPMGNVTNVIDPFNGQTRYEYDRVGRRARRVLPNNVVTEWQYDWRDRVTNITHKTSGGTTLASVLYERLPGGEPTKITREDGTYVELKYDAALRLTNEIYYSNSVAQVTNSYGYDASGSRVKLVKGGTTLTNAVSGGYRITEVKQGSTTVETYGYDSGGRVTTITRDGKTWNLGYNTIDQVTAATNSTDGTWVTYLHDVAGRRTMATNSAGIVRRLLVAPTPGSDLESPHLIANASGSAQQGYVYLGDDPILRYSSSGTAAYYLEDGMGSVIGIAPATSPGTENTTRLFYDGFGNTRATNGPSPTIPSGTGGDFRFHGAWLETESGLYHMRAREYDARLGRFTSRDPDGESTETPEGLHPYNYADCNPYVYSDPSGEFTMVEINVVTFLQFTLQTLRGVAVNEAKYWAIGKIGEAFGGVLLEQMEAFIPGFQWSRFSRYLSANPLGTGRAFDRAVKVAICSTIGKFEGVGDKIHMDVRVVNKGIRLGQPISAGNHCGSGLLPFEPNTPVLGQRRGARYSIPDFIIGQAPLVPPGGRAGTRKTYFVAEVKSQASTMYGEYISPGRNKKQLQAILGYSVRNTETRLAFFIVARNDMKHRIPDKARFYLMKRIIGFHALSHGVIPVLVKVL